jgi:YGGT family protein
MTDYQRTTTRETEVGGTPTQPYVAQTPAPAVNSVRTTESSYTPAGPGGATVASRVVTFAFGILQVLLILRIVLLLLVANPGNDVVGLIFGITQPFVEPFIGMFSLNRVEADQGSVLDIAAIVALIGWTLVEALILAAIRIFSRRPAEAV